MLALALAVLAAVAEPRAIPLVGNYYSGMAHACPTEHAIYTARHVIENNKDKEIVPMNSDYGPVNVLWRDEVRDIATISFPTMPNRLKVANKVEPGEKVYWYEYHFASTKKFMVQEKRTAKVVHTVAGYIVFDKGPEGGASGTCLVDENDQVVGIVVWSFEVRGSTKKVGLAVDITGEWKPKEE